MVSMLSVYLKQHTDLGEVPCCLPNLPMCRARACLSTGSKLPRYLPIQTEQTCLLSEVASVGSACLGSDTGREMQYLRYHSI